MPKGKAKGSSASQGLPYFSMIQTALENKLDPYQYLVQIMRKANGVDLSVSETIEDLLPWNMADISV